MKRLRNPLCHYAWGLIAVSLGSPLWAQVGGGIPKPAGGAVTPKPITPKPTAPATPTAGAAGPRINPANSNGNPAASRVTPAKAGNMHSPAATGLQPLLFNGRFVQPNGQLLQSALLRQSIMASRTGGLTNTGQSASALTPANRLLDTPLNSIQGVQTATNSSVNGFGGTAQLSSAQPGTRTDFLGNSSLNPNKPTQGAVRFPQSQIQSTTLGMNGLQTQLGLSSSQIAQLNQFQAAYNQELVSLGNRFATDPQGTAGLMNTAGQQLQQNINSVLTPSQRQALSRVTGQTDPFSESTESLNEGNTSSVAGRSLNNNNALNIQRGINSGANGLRPRTSTTSVSAFGAAAQAGSNLNLQSGFGVLSDPVLQQQLHLTTSQLGQLRSFQLQHVQQLNELASRYQTDPQGTTTLVNNASQQVKQQIGSVLSPQQRQLLTQLTGQTDLFSEPTTPANSTSANQAPE